MPMSEQQAQLLRQMLEPFIKGEANSEQAKEAFHQYTVSKTKDILEGTCGDNMAAGCGKSGDPLDNKAEDARAKDGKEIKADGEEAADPTKAKTSADVVASKKKVKAIAKPAEHSGDPLDNKTSTKVDAGKEIEA